MSYVRFNRHEAYTPEIMDLVRETINAVETHCIKTKQSTFNGLTNSLFGLYDGYLYDSLLIEAIEMDVPQDVFNNIKGIAKATQAYIALHGEGVTLV
jgi:benzoyl-CoA reductase/2-hydroxyglutaryl-CoA dehydratase subunit BcrC/BadD/HgdB